MNTYTRLGIGIFFLLVLSSFAFATLESTTDPTPTIRVAFSPTDGPVTVHSAKLLFSNGADLSIPKVPISNFLFDFPIANYLLSGEYTIEINVTDDDGNEKFITDTFTVEESQQKIWVLEPGVPFIPNNKQNFAIGNKTTFTLKLETITPATCRIKRYHPPLAGNLSVEYDAVGSASYFNNNPSSISKYHSINVLQSSGFLNSELRVQSPFDYNNIHKGEYVVICKQLGLGGATNYFAQPIFVGYDVTDPVLSVTFTPPIIEDPYDQSTVMQVESDGDLLVCSYDHTLNPLDHQKTPAGQLPSFNSVTSLQNYSANLTKKLLFPGEFFQTPSTNFTVSLSCENPAQRGTIITGNYTVAPKTNIIITVPKTNFGTKQPSFNISTNIMATCEVNFDDAVTVLTNSFSLHHQFIPGTLNDGTYSMDVTCEGAAGDPKTKTVVFSIDTTPPLQPNLIAPELSCGEDLLRLQIINASEPIRYNITLVVAGKLQSSELYPFGFQTADVNYAKPAPKNVSGVIEWSVYAIDQGGLKSQTATTSSKLTPYDPLLCDYTAPEVTVDVNTSVVNTTDGSVDVTFDINLTCFDEESGCDDMFDYKIIEDPALGCPGDLSLTHAVGEPLHITTGGLFCYEVGNRAGIKVNGSIELATEFKMTLISPEFGIGSTNPFSLELKTNRDALCRHGPVPLTQVVQTIEEQYNNFTEFSGGLNKNHVAAIGSEMYEALSHVEKDQASWKIICKEQSAYYEKKLTIGYDITPPVITVVATPNPLTDPENLYTDLVVTTDDKTVCTYLNTASVPTGFPNYDPHKESAYTKHHEVRIKYFATKPTTIAQSISCRNIAQLDAKVPYSIEIKPSNELGITFTSPNITDKQNTVVTWTTTRESDCTYRVSSNDPFKKAKVTGTLSHQQAESFDEGVTGFEVICELPNGNKKSYASTHILVDTKDPKLEFYTQAPSCTDNKLVFVAAADGTGSKIVEKNILVYGEEGIILHNVSFSTIQYSIQLATSGLSLEDAKVTITDEAGNSISKKYSIPSSSACDTVPPESTLTAVATWPGYALSVACQDNEECAPSYLHTTNQCLETETNLQLYKNQPVQQTESTDFCYWSYDVSGNLAEKKTQAILVENQCFNSIEDPNEEGLDCGGPCIAQCGTCSNGRLDPFELGVDCGGVCANECSTVEDDFIKGDTNTNSTDSFGKDECSVDADCSPGYICDAYGSCQRKSTTPTAEDEGISILGLILLIVGLLFIAGGVYYIWYSQNEKHSRQAQVQSQQSFADQQHSQELAAQKRKERLEELRKKHLAQEQSRESHLKDRKDQRKSLLSQFAVSTPTTQTETPKETLSEAEPVKISKPKKGSTDFINLDELHKDAAKKSSSKTFTDLSSLIETGTIPKSVPKETDTKVKNTSSKKLADNQIPHNLEEKTTSSNSKKPTSLDELADFVEEETQLFTKEQLLNILDDADILHDQSNLLTHLQELLDAKHADIPLITNALDTIVKKGSIEKTDVAKIIKQLKIK